MMGISWLSACQTERFPFSVIHRLRVLDSMPFVGVGNVEKYEKIRGCHEKTGCGFE